MSQLLPLLIFTVIYGAQANFQQLGFFDQFHMTKSVAESGRVKSILQTLIDAVDTGVLEFKRAIRYIERFIINKYQECLDALKRHFLPEPNREIHNVTVGIFSFIKTKVVQSINSCAVPRFQEGRQVFNVAINEIVSCGHGRMEDSKQTLSQIHTLAKKTFLAVAKSYEELRTCSRENLSYGSAVCLGPVMLQLPVAATKLATDSLNLMHRLIKTVPATQETLQFCGTKTISKCGFGTTKFLSEVLSCSILTSIWGTDKCTDEVVSADQSDIATTPEIEWSIQEPISDEYAIKSIAPHVSRGGKYKG